MKSLLIASALLMAGTAYAAPYQKAPASDRAPYAAKSVFKAAPQRVKSLGTGTYRDDILTYWWVVDNTEEWSVEVTESETTPGLYYIENPYANCPYRTVGTLNTDPQYPNYIEVHAEDPDRVYLGLSNAGLSWDEPELGKVGHLIVYSIAGDYYDNVDGDLDRAVREGLVGTLRDGSITFPINSLLGYMSPEIASAPTAMWKPVNGSGMWRLRLPGALKLDVKYTITQENNVLKLAVTMEDDVESVRIALVPGTDEDAAVQAVTDGTVEYTEINHDRSVNLDIPTSGKYVVTMVPYYDGQAKPAFTEKREFLLDTGEWVRCAQPATFLCHLLNPYTYTGNNLDEYFPVLDLNAWTATVPVEYKADDATKVRLVEPFSKENGNPYTNNTYDNSEAHFMTFDLSDPQQVVFETIMDMGFTYYRGPMAIKSKAVHMVENPYYEVVKGDAQYIKYCGKLNGRELTWPEPGSILFDFRKSAPDKWYWNDHGQQSKITFPQEVVDAVTGIRSINATDMNATPEYYSLQGIRLSEAPADGLYIERRGTTARIIMR